MKWKRILNGENKLFVDARHAIGLLREFVDGELSARAVGAIGERQILRRRTDNAHDGQFLGAGHGRWWGIDGK